MISKNINNGFGRDDKRPQEPSFNARLMSLNLRISTCEARLQDHSLRMDDYYEELNELRAILLEMRSGGDLGSGGCLGNTK
ncbi:MAG: hypothetical protein SFU25_10835 [Candidatus Caenarcaniphilales bacterium]|nr:hypothetical protein [Candidatus Caenarcaniphilales bacterium]